MFCEFILLLKHYTLMTSKIVRGGRGSWQGFNLGLNQKFALLYEFLIFSNGVQRNGIGCIPLIHH